MTAWNQAAAQMASTTGSAANVQQLAASYQLGTPLRAYRPTLPIAGFCGLFFALVNMGIGTIGMLLALFIPALRGFVGVSGIVVFLFMVAFGLLISLSARAYVRSGKTYECTEGFLEVDKDGAVKAAVRWDQMQVLWHKISVARSGNDPHNNTYLKHTYSVGIANGEEINVENEQLEVDRK